MFLQSAGDMGELRGGFYGRDCISMKDFVVVDSAQSFLSALAGISSGDAAIPRFKGWPIFHVSIEGERYHSTLTPRLMEGFVDFHDQLLRAYAEIRYGAPSLGRLTNLEKAELDLVFQISTGCTDGKGLLDDILNKLFSVLPMSKLSGAQTACLVTVIVLSFAGYIAFQEWTAYSTENHRIDVAASSDGKNAELISKLIQALADKELPVEAIRARSHAVEGYRSIAKGAPDATGMDIQGQHYDSQDLQRVRDNDPADRTRGPRTDDVYIEMIKRTKTSLSLSLRLTGHEYVFPGKVDLSTFAPQDVKTLFDSMRDSKKIRVQQFSVMEAGEIVSTSVLAVVPM
jgi:hypothetical protein